MGKFVPYNESLILKNLGLDIICFGFYNNADGTAWVKHEIDPVIKDIYTGDFEAPTYQQAFDFLLKEYYLYGLIIPTATMHWFFKTSTVVDKQVENIFPYNHNTAYDYEYSSHDEARKECLKRLIVLAKMEKDSNS